MQACLNFHNSITLDTDVRTIEGAEREVDIMYLGLTQAWYVDKTGKFAGYGIPTAAGWQWKEERALAGPVRNAINIQSRQASPAQVRGRGTRARLNSELSPAPAPAGRRPRGRSGD